MADLIAKRCPHLGGGVCPGEECPGWIIMPAPMSEDQDGNPIYASDIPSMGIVAGDPVPVEEGVPVPVKTGDCYMAVMGYTAYAGLSVKMRIQDDMEDVLASLDLLLKIMGAPPESVEKEPEHEGEGGE